MKKQIIKWDEFFELKQNKMVVFRVIPHQQITNNTNRKMWRALHRMMEMYDSLPSRLTRKGIKFTYREKDRIWFDIVFRIVDGKKKIEFYTAISEIWAKKYREVLENRMKVTIEEANLSDLQLPEEHTTVHELRYVRHDIFSLRTDAAEQTSPIGSILGASDDITENGEMSRVSFITETVSRQKWAKQAAYGHEILSKGREPQRIGITPRKLFKAAQGTFGKFTLEISSLIQDTMQAIERSFMRADNSRHSRTPLLNREIEKIERHTSSRTREKQFQPVWKTRARIAVHTENELRRDLIASSLSSAYAEIAEDNELNAVKIRIGSHKKAVIKELNSMQLSPQTVADGNVNHISCDELAKLVLQLPTADIQRRYEEELNINRKVQTEVPACFRDKSGILFGHSEVKGEQIPVHIPVKNKDELFRTYVFQGSPRMGKDTAIKNFVVEACLKHGIGAVIPDAIMEDGERGMSDGIRDALPPDKVIDIDLSNTDYPVPLDMTAIIKKLGRNGMNRFAQELIDFFGDVEGMGQTRSLLREAAKASGGNIHNIQLLLTNEDYRVKTITQLRKEGLERLADYWQEWKQAKLESKASPILYRLDEFLGDDSLLNIFSQPPHPEFNLEKWMQEGKVVIFRVPNRKLGALATRTLVHWITLQVFMTRMLMPADSGTFLVMNEPHQFMTPGLQRMLQRILLEGPKWRCAALFAFHHIGLLPRNLQDDLLSSSVNWFLFANSHKGVYQALEEELKPAFDIESAMQTEARHAISILQFDGRRQRGFLCHMIAPPTDRYEKRDNSFLTARQSRMLGRKWTDVEQMISKKERGA